MFGSNMNKGSSNNMDDIFGKRKSPTDQNLFGSRKNSKDNLVGSGAKTSELTGRKTPVAETAERRNSKQEKFSRESPAPQPFSRQKSIGKEGSGNQSPMDEIFKGKKGIDGRLSGARDSPGKKSPLDDMFGAKRGTDGRLSGGRESSGKPSTMDDIFGAKKRAQSPLFSSKQPGNSDRLDRSLEREDGFRQEGYEQRKPQPSVRKGSYMSSLLADSDEEREKSKSGKTSYLDNLLAEGNGKGEPVSHLLGLLLCIVALD